MKKVFAMWIVVVVFLISACGVGPHKKAGPFPIESYDELMGFPTTFEKINLDELIKEYPQLKGRVMTAEQYIEEYEKELKKRIMEERPMIEWRFIEGTRFTIKVVNHPDLTRTFTVPPDGIIELDYFYDVLQIYVVGKTRDELRRELEMRLSKYIKRPRVSLIPEAVPTPVQPVLAYPERYAPTGIAYGTIAVFGAAWAGGWWFGQYPFTGRETLVYILSIARPSWNADWRRIRVIRRSDEDPLRKGVIIFCDLWDYFALADMRQDIPLRPGDVIYVPPIKTGESEFRRNLDLILSYINRAFSFDAFLDAFKKGGAFRGGP